jgi:hypothetical protein
MPYIQQYSPVQVLQVSQFLKFAGGGLIVHLRDTRHVESDWLLSKYSEIALNSKSQYVSDR